MDIAGITKAATKDALEGLRRAESLKGNPLLDMRALRLRLRASATTITDESLEWALSGLMTEIVERELARARNRDAPDPEASRRDRMANRASDSDVHPRGGAHATQRAPGRSERDLEADLTSAGPDREAWACLHARYLAADTLQVQEIGAIARPGSPHGRKFASRRIDRGLSMLADRLRDEEERAHRERAAPERRRTEARRHNLPARRTSFVGREEELAAVTDLLGRMRLVTLVGPAGVGKTRLAVQSGLDALDDYPDGAWLVELAPLASGDLVPQGVAGALGVREQERETLAAALERELASRSLLLLLDNCEHVVGEAAQLADSLLAAAPGLRILATSREALGLEGEHVFPVQPLAVSVVGDSTSGQAERKGGKESRGDPGQSAGDAGEGRTKVGDAGEGRTNAGDAGAARSKTGVAGPADLALAPAVQLFLDRAAEAHASFEADDETASEVAELCRRLDGLPLAIELAGALAGVLPVDELLARLEDRFRLLTGGRRIAEDRQLTLRGAFDWSYELLSASERATLRSLSVFRGGWSMPAAESVCAAAVSSPDTGEGTDDVLAHVMALTAKSLVAPSTGGAEARFHMLESIRQYAADRLSEKGEAIGARERHQAYYLQLAEEADAALEGPEQHSWLERLAREHDNCAAALGTGTESDAAAQRTLRLAAALARFWQLRGRLSAGRRWMAFALALPANSAPSPDRARALNGAGTLAYLQGDYRAAKRLHEEGLSIERGAGNEPGVAAALRSLGKVADAVGDYEIARSRYDEALAIYEAADDTWGRAATLNNLGLVALREDDAVAARERLEMSLRAFRELGDRWAVGVSLSNLGDAAVALSDLTTAQGLFDESLTIARELGDRDGEAYALTSLGSVACRGGDAAASREYLEEALAPLLETEAKVGIAEWIEAAARLASQTDEASRAVTLLAAADALRKDIDAPLPAKDRSSREELLADLTGRLPQADFDRAWHAGRRMGWQDAVEC